MKRKKKMSIKKRAARKPTFYILWAPSSARPPKVRFTTQRKAEEIAEKMCLEHHCEFFVMKAIAVKQPGPPQTVSYTGRESSSSPAPAKRANGDDRYDSFDGWRGRGRTVNFGEKSLRHDKGVALFHISQTKMRRELQPDPF